MSNASASTGILDANTSSTDTSGGTQTAAHHRRAATLRLAALALATACALNACGGGNSSGSAAASASTTGIGPASAAGSVLPASVVALPTFHMAAVTPPAPSDIDVGGTNASAHQAPLAVPLSADAATIDTARLSPESLRAQLQGLAARSGAGGVRSSQRAAAPDGAKPLSSAVYTPAQIRAAYGLPALPATGAGLSSAAAIALGAGQTIYLVDAYDDPNAFADLNTFSTNFGLPTCTLVTVTPSTALPLGAPGTGCQLLVAYPNGSGSANSGAPAYDAGWAPEIALDVQWAHAMAPLARIVLLESQSASLTDLLGSVLLANQMGPGVLSMSFGAGEGSWVASTDSYFAATGMTYLASTGDSGSGVSWPAVSRNVLAVGGTSLNYSGSTARSETAWSGSGGGISAYESLPAYQNGVAIAGGGTLHYRAVADVSFNADPNTGQYVVITPPGGTAGWYIYGGTSISSPQWAGVLALVNANRIASGQSLLGDVHAALYGQVAEVPGNYAQAFDDIVSGADGSCATCSAAVGYDQPTGWGTPNFASLLAVLDSAPSAPPLPGAVLPGGIAGVAYSASWAASDAAHNPLAYSTSGAPAGLTVSSSGALSWSQPLAGSYSFAVTVRNTAGRTATGNVALTIVPAPAAPTVPGGTIVLKTGSALSVSLGVTAPANSGTLSYSLSGAPAGLTVSSGGMLTWSKGVAGKYTLTATATNSYGRSASGVYVLTVIAEAPPVFSGSTQLSAVAGNAYSSTFGVSDPNGATVLLSLAGAPAGLTLGSGGVLSWLKPVAGIYTLTVKATDAYGYSASAIYALSVYAPPVVPGASFTGNTGAPFSASAGAHDPIGSALTYALGGAPAGLTINASGMLAWAAPVKGVYSFTITAHDVAGLATSASYHLTVLGLPQVPGASLSAPAGATWSQAVAASDPNGSALTFSMSGAPAGLVISASGVLSWTKAVKGSYTLTITARDALGLSGIGKITLTVS